MSSIVEIITGALTIEPEETGIGRESRKYARRKVKLGSRVEGHDCVTISAEARRRSASGGEPEPGVDDDMPKK